MKRSLAFVVMGMCAASAYALPDYDPFADATGSGGTLYTVGANLVGQTNAQGLTWFAAGSAAGNPVIAAGNLTIAGLTPPSGNSVSFGAPSAAGTSARLGLGGSVNSGSLYYSFAFQINTIGALTTAFVAGFNNSSGSQSGQPSVVGTRLYTRVSGAGFNLGVNKADGTAGDIVWDPTTYNAGSTFFLVGSYTFNSASSSDDVSQLWIDPDPSTFGAGTAPAASLIASAGADIGSSVIASFLIREASNVEPGTMTLDELRIGTSWADVTPSSVPEPSSLALAGLGFLALLSYSRFRRR